MAPKSCTYGLISFILFENAWPLSHQALILCPFVSSLSDVPMLFFSVCPVFFAFHALLRIFPLMFQLIHPLFKHPFIKFLVSGMGLYLSKVLV